MTNIRIHGVDEAIANLKIWEWGDNPTWDLDDVLDKVRKIFPNEEELYRHGAKVVIEQVSRDLHSGYLSPEYMQGVGLTADLHLLESDIVATFNLNYSIEMLVAELSNEVDDEESSARQDAVSLAADFRKWAETLEEAAAREPSK